MCSKLDFNNEEEAAQVQAVCTSPHPLARGSGWADLLHPCETVCRVRCTVQQRVACCRWGSLCSLTFHAVD
jgi:hypothetical protein